MIGEAELSQTIVIGKSIVLKTNAHRELLSRASHGET
jgi:hypothetical protein